MSRRPFIGGTGKKNRRDEASVGSGTMIFVGRLKSDLEGVFTSILKDLEPQTVFFFGLFYSWGLRKPDRAKIQESVG